MPGITNESNLRKFQRALLVRHYHGGKSSHCDERWAPRPNATEIIDKVAT